MKSVLLVGAGRFGKHFASKLYELGHEIMVVDTDEEKINTLLPYVTNAQIGDSTNPNFLKTLDVDKYDVCVVAIGDNFQNSLETTYLLHEMGAKHVIARASRGMQEKFLKNNGADEVIYPEKQLAIWTALACTSEHIIDYREIDENYSLVEIDVPDSWDGKSVGELNVRSKYGINILGIRENGKLNMNIRPETVLDGAMHILVVGENALIQKYFGE